MSTKSLIAGLCLSLSFAGAAFADDKPAPAAKPTETKAAAPATTAAPATSKAADAKPAEAKPAEAKPADAKPAAGGAAPNAQQTKMVTCNKEAGDKKGEERAKFMKECLKADKDEKKDDKGEKKELKPKEAMGACQKAAKDKSLKGQERKTFVSECLKAKGPANMK